MEILSALLLVLIILFVSSILSSIIVNFKSYKYYKPVYKSLKMKTFYKTRNIPYSIYDSTTHNLDEENSINFIYFTEDKDFCLSVKDRIYLHNSSFTYTDPYSLYWYIKYRLWFKKNVNVEKINFYY